LTRGTMTLLGAATAGALLWIASQTDAEGLAGYWSYVGLLAAAGLVMALSQLLGGWTKWGWPRVSGTVFLLGFLPALALGGLVLLHAQPEDAFGRAWAGDIGLEGLAEDLTAVLPALAFGLGLLFGFTFDTTGPRRAESVEDVERRDVRQPGYADRVPAGARVADEPVAAERAYAGGDRDRDGVDDRDQVATRTSVDRDRDGVDDRDQVTTRTSVDRDRDGVDDRDQVTAATRVDRDADGVDDRDEAAAARREDGRLR
jgi:hypothetical protein